MRPALGGPGSRQGFDEPFICCRTEATIFCSFHVGRVNVSTVPSDSILPAVGAYRYTPRRDLLNPCCHKISVSRAELTDLVSWHITESRLGVYSTPRGGEFVHNGTAGSTSWSLIPVSESVPTVRDYAPGHTVVRDSVPPRTRALGVSARYWIPVLNVLTHDRISWSCLVPFTHTMTGKPQG